MHVPVSSSLQRNQVFNFLPRSNSTVCINVVEEKSTRLKNTFFRSLCVMPSVCLYARDLGCVQILVAFFSPRKNKTLRTNEEKKIWEINVWSLDWGCIEVAYSFLFFSFAYVSAERTTRRKQKWYMSQEKKRLYSWLYSFKPIARYIIFMSPSITYLCAYGVNRRRSSWMNSFHWWSAQQRKVSADRSLIQTKRFRRIRNYQVSP